MCINLSLNPSPRGEGLNKRMFLLPFSPGRRVPIAIGRGMR